MNAKIHILLVSKHAPLFLELSLKLRHVSWCHVVIILIGKWSTCWFGIQVWEVPPLIGLRRANMTSVRGGAGYDVAGVGVGVRMTADMHDMHANMWEQ